MPSFYRFILVLWVPFAASALPVFAAEPASLLIKNALVVTMNDGREIQTDGVVVIDGDTIVAVGDESLIDQYTANETLDADGDILIPGMINLHNHVPMVAFRGLAEDGYAVGERLFNFFFPLEKALLDRELIYVSARHAVMEMALGGVTTYADMYYHEDEVARATKEVGLRGVLGETIIGFPVVDAPEPYGGLAYAEQFIKRYVDDDLITPAVAPHAPYTVSPEKLLQAKALADKYDVPILMHMSEIEDEHQRTKDAFGDLPSDLTIIQYLDRLGFLSDRLVGAHVIYTDQTDITLLKDKGVGVGHNPKANTKDMSGLAAAWEMYNAGVDVGLGTDGPMSSNQMDVLSVMQYAARVARIRHGSGKPFKPIELVEMATLGGARALDMEDRIGSIEVGKLADMVLIDTKAANMQPNYDVYATLVYAAYPPNVKTTIVNGRIIVRDRDLLTLDLDAHQDQWQKIQAKVAAFAATLDAE